MTNGHHRCSSCPENCCVFAADPQTRNTGGIAAEDDGYAGCCCDGRGSKGRCGAAAAEGVEDGADDGKKRRRSPRHRHC